MKLPAVVLTPLTIAISLATLTTLTTITRAARADAPSPELVKKLAAHAEGFERMKKHASYDVEGTLSGLARDEHTTESVKAMKAKVVADGANVRFEIVRYQEDGVDKTEEAKKKQRERAAEKKKEKRDIHMPFLASEQARYVFEQKGQDAADPNRVEISFVPKVRAEDTIEGSAWVDVKRGTIISSGFKLSETPTFVEYVHITVEFGAPTSLGPAVSHVVMDGKGGILFWSKMFHLDATLSGYQIVP